MPAYHLTHTQGVAATANASFNSACGYSGDTFAYSYARATVGTTTTTHTQSDPDAGTSITSAASSTVNGGSVPGIPCYSEASSYAQSSALGISYSTSDLNDNYCPVPQTPMNVSISGPSWLYFTDYGCSYHTWSATATGTAPFSYAWYEDGYYLGSGSTYSRFVCANEASFTLSVTATGSDSRTDSDSLYVTVYYEPSNCPPREICQVPY